MTRTTEELLELIIKMKRVNIDVLFRAAREAGILTKVGSFRWALKKLEAEGKIKVENFIIEVKGDVTRTHGQSVSRRRNASLREG